MRDLGASGDRYQGGTIMDPDDGKLKVRGYLGLFYRTQTWLKGS